MQLLLFELLILLLHNQRKLVCLLLALETLVFAALVELVVVATAESVAQAQVAWYAPRL